MVPLPVSLTPAGRWWTGRGPPTRKAECDAKLPGSWRPIAHDRPGRVASVRGVPTHPKPCGRCALAHPGAHGRHPALSVTDMDVADRPQGRRRRKVAQIAEARVERLLDRIADRHRPAPERLVAFLAEQVEAEKDMGMSDVVRQAITASGLSLGELGRQAGISTGQLSRFVRGERSLTLESADKLAKVLKLRMVRGKAPRKK